MTHTPSAFHSMAVAGPSPLNAVGSVGTAVPSAVQHQKLVEQAQKWVAQTFFGALLKQVRQSPFRSELFDGGRGGQAYGALYDQQMAEHMARGVGQKFVNSIVRKIEAKQAYQKAAAKNGKTDGKLLKPSTERSSHVTANLRG